MTQAAWIFDLDGTLTVPQHDFAALKRELGLEPGLDILGGIARLPEALRGAAHERVRAWEVEHIERSQLAPGARELLDGLREAGTALGILTRNTRSSALHTLEVIGLTDVFAAGDVLGRTCAAPKPSPAGVERLLGRWGITPARATFVGDHLDDLRAGRTAGTRTVWVDHRGDGRFSHAADRTVRSLREMIDS